ncbi:hypothetical protein BDK89_3408 [Ilumatobacter fluminis]|uniref:Uncharacterized protein n=1 Tax=Ilumatobacter fluminis TaxID=467091 RepID=A0A4R7I2V6_9ACTN|nr:hypothetical protein BDK89_3408 [Ilumatobacter fluminis]
MLKNSELGWKPTRVRTWSGRFDTRPSVSGGLMACSEHATESATWSGELGTLLEPGQSSRSIIFLPAL